MLCIFGDRRVLDKNGEVDPTIFPAVSDMQLAAYYAITKRPLFGMSGSA
jgi:hypothetical protein